jgi:spermidine synthase
LPRLFAIGFLSMVGQVVLLRELAVASFGVELIYLLGVGVWLVAGAAGAVAGRDRRGAPPRLPIESALAGFGALLLVEIAFLRGSRLLFGGVPGAYLPIGRQLSLALLGVAPAGMLLGRLFRHAARRVVDGGATLAAAYGWESAGGAAGSAAATLSLFLGVSNLRLGVGAALAAALFAAGAAGSRRVAAGLLAVAGVTAWQSDALDRRMTGWNHPALEAARDTPYGRIALENDRGMRALFVNDAFEHDTEGVESETFAHLAALQLPAGSRILLLGGDAAGLVPELLKHEPERIVCVERDRVLHETVLRHLPAGRAAAFGDPRVRVVFADPRRFLAGGERFDLVLVGAADPSSGSGNRLLTVEFFRLCAGRMPARGVLALRLPSSETLWTPRLLERNGGVHAALAAAFGDVFVVPGGSDTFLASRGSVARDPSVLAGRLAERGIVSRAITRAQLVYLMTNDRVAEAGRRLASAKAPANSDSRPICYQQTAMLWFAMLLPSGELPAGIARGGALLLLLSGIAFAAACRRRPGWRPAALAAVAGFCGMIVEAVVLLRFQAESGTLYGWLGLLLTCFMAGLAAGALAFDRLAKGVPGRLWGVSLLASVALLALAVAAASAWAPAAFRLAPSAALLAAGAALTAALFSYASRVRHGEAGAGIAALYASDLLGGCLGSILAGLALIPLYGAGPVALGTALLALASILLV